MLCLGPVACFAAVISFSLGQPTYSSVSSLTIDRGTFAPGAVLQNVGSSGYKSAGASGARSGPILGAAPPGTPDAPSAAGSASDTQLRSFSRASGILGYTDTRTPLVEATNRSEVTRYFTFSNTAGSTVDLDFLGFFDGTLRGRVAYELLQRAFSRVVFGLDVIDTTTGATRSVFQTQAQLSLLRGSNDWALSTLASGAADPANLAGAFAERTGGSFFEVIFDARFAEVLNNAVTVPENTVIGLNWFLETTVLMEGELVFNSLIESDFDSTANIDFRISAADASTSSFEEVLSVPGSASTLPLPGTGWLLGAALALGGVARGRSRMLRWAMPAIARPARERS